jgi:Fe-S-cluster containining protein
MFLEKMPEREKRLELEDSFRFRCHEGLSCFNTCCRSKLLPLTPYDVLRLRAALGIHSDQFLQRYTAYSIDRGSGFPVVHLSMQEDGARNCPFVTEKGCGVYEDRPMACRLYPLARFARAGEGAGRSEAFYTLLDTPACLGRWEERALNVQSWIADQGLGSYLEINDRFTALVFHPQRDKGGALSQDQLQKVMVACYNLDLFREFVFNTPFLDLFKVDPETRERVKEDDLALMKLGIAYLKRVLFNARGSRFHRCERIQA